MQTTLRDKLTKKYYGLRDQVWDGMLEKSEKI